ncbi:UvrB/UvrC motif-containing protein [Amphibacillus sediminis]|uniref:UvrB/UvrC motif-containing protein n=1 Tax=Amphibacillus sediminis TaxID=360185 RepID=UPI00083774BE|nr:UvrB/UvrC motif-containing protein [Amphibacillus sediminis]
MDCENCHQRPATLHLTNYINGEKTEIHVCQHCAIEKGYIEGDDETYTIHDLLSGLFNFNTPMAKKPEPQTSSQQELTCPHCNMSYLQFAKTGKFGCSHCYQTFKDHLNPLFRRIHSGNTEHIGKIPKRQYVHLQKKRQIQDYREQLKQLIAQEAFEEAAKLRDKIKALEQASELNRDEEGE